MLGHTVRSVAAAAVLACIQISFVNAACPTIITRAQWGARAPTNVKYLAHQPVPYGFIHHTAGADCHDRASCVAQVKITQNYHMDDRGYSDMGYSFMIGGEGGVYEARGWDRVGAHTLGYNDNGLGFCLIGNFMTHMPTTAQLNAVKNLLACGVSLGKLASSYTLKGHRDVGSTACPGDQLYANIKSWPHYG